jgi:RNA polymerase sigma-70 factor (ECF subfamily)
MERPIVDLDAAWRELYVEHRRAVFAVCYSLLGNVADADNAAQDTFLKAARHLKRLPEVRDARLWLTRIAVRTCLDQRKSFWGRLFHSKAEVPDQMPGGTGPEQELLAGEEQEKLRRSLQQLPEKQRVAVTLRFYHDLDTVGIARVMGISSGAVKTHLHRGLRKLKTLYEVEP